MEDACKGSPHAFDKLLSVSDEAFMLVVMENYVEQWHAAVLAKGTGAPQMVSLAPVNSISITGFKPMLLTWRIFYKQQDDEETEDDEEERTTPPVSLCVPWQMSVKEVANINTVLTYI